MINHSHQETTGEGIATGIITGEAIDAVHDHRVTEGVGSLMSIHIRRAVTIARANARIDTLAEMADEMIGHGTAIEEIGPVEVIEMTEECQGEMRGETTLIGHLAEIETYSRAAWTGGQVEGVEVHQEAIVMNLLCRWGVGIGRKAPVLHQRKRSLLLI